MITFSVEPHEADLLEQIAHRAMTELWPERADPAQWRKWDGPSKLHLLMDLTAVHANGCPLRLGALLEAHPFDFAHDIGGIRRHLNRETGQLEDHFLPRYAAPERERVTDECTAGA